MAQLWLGNTMRKIRTRKGPPPHLNRKLIQATREAAAAKELAEKKSAPVPVDNLIDIKVEIPPLEKNDEERKS